MERMSFGQIALYLNEGMRFKYPRPQQNSGSLVGASAGEIRGNREELRTKYGSVEGA